MTSIAHPIIRPAGDAAIRLDLGAALDFATNRQVHAIAEHLMRELEGWTAEVVPAYSSLLISYDPLRHSYEDVEAALLRAGRHARRAWPGRRFLIPTVYGGEEGPDLAELACRHGLATEQVIALHADRDYPIYCLGFSPGFPYLGGLDPRLHTPRLDRPRPRVPRGSVAIGGSQTGIYPTETPGGWHLIGRTPLTLFDVRTHPPIPYAPGDVIRFLPIGRHEAEQLRGRMPVGEPL